MLNLASWPDLIILLIQQHNYLFEARTRNYWNAGIATKLLDHGGGAKGYTCIDHMNIYSFNKPTRSMPTGSDCIIDNYFNVRIQ